MTLIEKFANLNPEQREKFAALKDAAGLETFVSEQGIDLNDEEKTQAQEYFQSGMLPLNDDDLDAVAGGSDKNAAGNCPACNSLNTYMSNEYQRSKCRDCGHEWK